MQCSESGFQIGHPVSLLWDSASYTELLLKTELLLELGCFEGHRLKTGFLVLLNPVLTADEMSSTGHSGPNRKAGTGQKHQSMFQKQQTSKIQQGIHSYCLKKSTEGRPFSPEGKNICVSEIRILSSYVSFPPREGRGEGSGGGVLTLSGAVSLSSGGCWPFRVPGTTSWQQRKYKSGCFHLLERLTRPPSVFCVTGRN